MIGLKLSPLIQASDPATMSDTSSHKFCKNGSFPILGFCNKKVPLQLGAKPKLNFLAVTLTNIFVRHKKSNPKIAGKGPPLSTLNSWSHENESSFTWILTASVTSHLCPSANIHVTEHDEKTHGSSLK
jgi:hypothetical protein